MDGGEPGTLRRNGESRVDGERLKKARKERSRKSRMESVWRVWKQRRKGVKRAG